MGRPQILTTDTSHLGSVLGPVAADTFLLNLAIENLRAYSLVRRDPKGKPLSIHRLVQSVLKDRLEEAEQRSWAKRAVLALAAAFPTSKHETWSQCERLLPCAELCARYIEQYQIESREAKRLLARMVDYLQDRARYAEAEPLLQQILRIWEQQVGPEDYEMAIPLNALAELYRKQGKYELAEPLFQWALRICERSSPGSPLELTLLNGLVKLYFEQGKDDEAKSLYQRAMSIRWRSMWWRRDPRETSELNHQARLYRKQGKYELAESLYQQALRIWEQQVGPEHPDICISLGNLAWLYLDQDKYAQAKSLFQRALRIYEQLTPESSEVAGALSNLAWLYWKQGKYELAEPLFQRALHIREQEEGEIFPDTVRTIHNLAEIYTIQGKYVQAETLLQRALHNLEQELGPSPKTTVTIDDTLCWETGNIEGAGSWNSIAVAREEVVRAHRETRTRLIALLRAMGRREEASQLETDQSEG